MKKFLKPFLALGLCAVALTAAACDLTSTDTDGSAGDDKKDPTGGGTETITYTEYTRNTLKFTDNSNANSDSYNHDLYYRNDLDLDMGDPMLVYDNGKFYTCGTRGGDRFDIFTSTDLTSWDSGTLGFKPASSSWGKTGLWAPDIQKFGDKWYLYYTANYNGNCQIGVAIADSPAGPYTEYTGTNKNGEVIDLSAPPFKGMEDCTILDQHVFRDDNGKYYMYFSYDMNKSRPQDPKSGVAEIWGVEMKDPVTWDLTTLTRLIRPGYKTVDATRATIDWETWSPSFENGMECTEGPYMIKNGGKYYLTYCANSFVDTEYAVGYAVADSPLGPFTKPDGTFLENMLLGVPGQTGEYINNRYLGFTTGTGHASICKIGDEYMFAYHAHYNRDKWGALTDIYGEKSQWRALGVDYLYFDKDGKPYTNGPTYSLQPLPSVVTGYTNLAKDATVKIEGTGAEYINDGFTNRAFNTKEECREAQFAKGTKSIEITFSRKVNVKCVNVYNSYDYEKKTDFISQIDFGENRGIKNILFNKRYLNTELDFIYPHAAYNIELDDEVLTDRIVITFESETPFAVGEVEIIGRKNS